ncbi:MAG TPA: nicotinate-nicotinamide nucleotide adenylyltransferase [bacterium]|nr:nicotinate-nicotinamide nucleotide adenylyltransferase [bacterium]
MSRVALLGGSFDPPHSAHLQVARHLLDSGDFDEVWVLPSPQNPLKPSSSSFEDRLAMCRLAFAGLEPAVQVHDDERALSGFTIDLARKLRAEHPDREFRFVGGSDLREELPRWKDSAELRKLLGFVFLPRPPDPASPFLPISSREIRERAKKGLSLAGLLPPSVERYIQEHRLYR